MPRLSKAMKDAAGGDMLRGGAEQPLIRRFPNGGTQQSKPLLSRASEERTRGSKTFQYPEEKRPIVFPK